LQTVFKDWQTNQPGQVDNLDRLEGALLDADTVTDTQLLGDSGNPGKREG